MKRVFILFAALGLTIGASAQQVPNGGFETWSDTINPDHWGTIADVYGPSYPTFAQRDTTTGNHVEGQASLLVFSDSVPGQGAIVSEVGLGTATATQGISFTGIPYAKRPDTLFAFVKYVPGPGAVADTAYASINLTKAGVSLFGGTGYFVIPAIGAMTEIAIPLSAYYSSAVTGAPDTLSLVFYSGNIQTRTSVYGSRLYVDYVHFDASVNVTGIKEIGAITGVNAYPNPANNTVNISVAQDEIGSRIQLFDMTGREVYNGTISTSDLAINTQNFETGIYAIRVNSIDNLTTYKGKISVAH
jgi:hypothetical protein